MVSRVDNFPFIFHDTDSLYLIQWFYDYLLWLHAFESFSHKKSLLIQERFLFFDSCPFYALTSYEGHSSVTHGKHFLKNGVPFVVRLSERRMVGREGELRASEQWVNPNTAQRNEWWESFSHKKSLLIQERFDLFLVGREGFEPSKDEPVDLQSTPFDHSGIDPRRAKLVNNKEERTNNKY